MKDKDIKTLNLDNKNLISVLEKDKEGLTMSSLARKLDTNIYNIKNDLAVLENKNIIIITDAGKSKLVRLRK